MTRLHQIAGLAWRDNRLWAALLGGLFVGRTAFDWLVPAVDFHARATTSTFVGAGILFCAGFWGAWRSNSVRAGALAGVATASLSAIVSIIGVASLLAIWHDAQTLAAIQGSGGLEEAFTLPVMMVIPGVCLGTLGGLFGGAARKVAPYMPR